MQIVENKDKKLDPRDFAFWLQGFFEISEAKTLNEKQVKMIKEHLELIFTKITPEYTITTSDTSELTQMSVQPLYHKQTVTYCPKDCKCLACQMPQLSDRPSVLIC